MTRCPDSHYVTCCACGVVWHLAHMDLPLPRGVAWMCPDCAPPDPHCDTCTCNGKETE